ncbi:unnamed protein product [Durusdinium trenchii]|uniref:J domain-containing protein n=1 Tax=Durusdinium trenchii TaxID=1381693 RepID=A0ABP0SDH9_9DINO
MTMVSEPVDTSCVPGCGKECSGQGCKMGKCEDSSAEGETEKPAPAKAETKKAEGNAAFQAKNFEEATRLYGEAIALAEAAGEPVPGVYFSNRAVCLASLNDWEGARSDAAQALSCKDLTPAATKKALFQKSRAESRLLLVEELEATLRLADSLGLRAEVERLLGSDLPTKTQVDARADARKDVENRMSGAVADVVFQEAQAQAEASPVPQPASQAKEAGTARYRDGDYRGAITHYRQAMDLAPADDAGLRAQLLGNIAAACLMLKKAAECATACEESLALDSSNSKVRARLASAQVARGDFAAARATVGEVNGEDSALTNALKQIGSTEATLAEADQALSKGEPAKALNMYANLESSVLFDYPPLTLKMAHCYLDLRQYPRVLNTTQQILRSNPTSIDALLLRTQALYRNHNATADSKQWVEPLEQGQRLLKEALSLDPDHSEAQALRKRLRSLCTKHAELKELMDSREFEQGQAVIDSMLELCQDHPVLMASLYAERAKACMRLKDWRGVIKDVGQATYRNHSLVQPYLYRAQALQALERHEDAVKELESLLSWHQVESVYHKLEEAKFLLRKHKRRNYYEVLGVPSVASQLEIKKAYRERAAEWHPDKKSHLDEASKKNAEEMFKCIGEAYEVLTDPTKKELYEKGYDLEGINEQIELKKRRTNGCCGGRPGGGCC